MNPSAQEASFPTACNCKVSLANRIGRWVAPVFLLMVDYSVIIAALFSAYYLRDTLLPLYFTSLSPLNIPARYLYFVMPLIYIGLISYERLYSRRLPFWQCAGAVFKICSYAGIIIVGLIYFAGVSKEASRIFVLISWLFSFVFLVIARYFTKRFMASCGLWQKPVVIVGAGKTAGLLAKSFEEEPGMGYKIVGLVEDHYVNNPLVRRFPLLGTFANVEQAIVNSEVDEVILATPSLGREELLDLVYRIQPKVRNLTIVPDLFGIPMTNIEVEPLLKEKTVLLRVRNNLTSSWNCRIKRIFDLCLGSIALFLLIPVMLIISIIIKMDSLGPVFHVAERLGKHGEKFWCFKFRTMYLHNESIFESYLEEHTDARAEWEKYYKLKNYDPRVTKAGRWLRQYSLDELPQIINVIKGDMSLVGPRPYLPRELGSMKYMAATILETVPGITGLWQVSGRNEIDFEGRLHMDAFYVRNWSLWQDIVLLLKTIGVVLGKKGAY